MEYSGNYFLQWEMCAYVNGVIVNVGEEASVKEGKILLQSEYAEIYSEIQGSGNCKVKIIFED